MRKQIIPYNPRLKQMARMLRNNMTLAEILLWNELKQKQMLGFDFHRQKPIDEYVVDFFCPKLSLVIEIDGDSHEGKFAQDKLRQEEIEKYGISVMRFPDAEVRENLDGVLEAIQSWIRNHRIQPRRGRCSLTARQQTVRSL